MRHALPALSLVAVSLGAAPAAADPLPPYTPTTLTLVATVKPTVVPFSPGWTDGTREYGMAVTCTAAVAGAVAATVIEECRFYAAYVPRPDAHPAAAPGNAAVSAFREIVRWGFDGPRPGDHLCVTAYTIPLHAPTTPLRLSTCTAADAADGIDPLLGPSQSGTASRTW